MKYKRVKLPTRYFKSLHIYDRKQSCRMTSSTMTWYWHGRKSTFDVQ